MASIHKDARGKSPYWFCALTRANGQRTFKSTKTTDKAEAQSLCEKWQAAEEITKSPALQNTALVAEHFLEATRKAAQGQFGENDARKVLNAVLEAAGLAPLPFSTIEVFFRDRLAAHALHKSSATAKRYGDVLEPSLTHLGERAKHGLTSLTSRDVESFRDAQIAAGKSNVTANFAVSIIRFALNVARRKGLIPANPAEQVEKLTEDAGERMPFSAEQLKDLLAVADAEWQGMIIVGCTAGLRIGDAAKLTWANVDLSRHVLRFRPEKTSRQKNGKALEVPLLPDLENYLLALPSPSRQPNAPLFPALIRRKITGNSGLSNTFSRLIATAGIENEPAKTKAATKTKSKGRSVFPYSFHSLRHSFVSIMANAGVPKETRMKLAGHTTNVHDKYTHLELESLRSAMASLPSPTSK